MYSPMDTFLSSTQLYAGPTKCGRALELLDLWNKIYGLC